MYDTTRFDYERIYGPYICLTLSVILLFLNNNPDGVEMLLMMALINKEHVYSQENAEMQKVQETHEMIKKLRMLNSH